MVYEQTRFILEQLRQTGSPENPAPAQGILLLGEAGTGKTHLLMRVAQNLARENYILFVPRPNFEQSVTVHIWSSIMESLTRVVPGRSNSRTQLDDLLAHVFARVLIPAFRQNQTDQTRRWADQLERDPFNLFSMLGTDSKQRQKNLNAIRNRTLNYLERHAEVDQTVARALITYCLISEPNRKRNLLTWLKGKGGLDPTEADSLRLPQHWVEEKESSKQREITRARELFAQRAICTLGRLSAYYQPLILAFDQLEGLRDDEELTLCWGEVMRELITHAPNFLVLACVFLSLWQEWFEPVLENNHGRSAAERIAAIRLELEPFQVDHGLQLLRLLLAESVQRLGLPSDIYPFTEEAVARLCRQGTTPRAFIQQVAAAFRNWLFTRDGPPPPPRVSPPQSPSPRNQQTLGGKAGPGTPPRPKPPLPQGPSASTAKKGGGGPPRGPSPLPPADIDSVLRDELRRRRALSLKAYPSSIPDEEDLLGRLRTLVRALLKDSQPAPRYDTAECDKKVMPFNLVVRDPEGLRLCLAVLNSTGNALTARLRNLRDVADRRSQFEALVILRDRRCAKPGTVGQQHLDAILEGNSRCFELDGDDLARLNAIYDTLVDVEQRNICISGRPVEQREFIDYVRRNGDIRDCCPFGDAAELSPILASAMIDCTVRA
jgi:hypothetical protein